MPPERITAVVPSTASPARAASSAATPTAPAPSTTSLARSSRNTIASATSSSETTTSPSTHWRMSASVSAPGRLTAIPSAMVSAEGTATGSPAASEAGNGAHASTCTPITSTSGRCDFTAMATPLIRPPPPTGATTRRRSGAWASSSRPTLPWPATTIRIVERVHERVAAGRRELLCRGQRLVHALAHQPHLGPQRGGGLGLGDGRRLGHEHVARHSSLAGRVGDRLGVVAGAGATTPSSHALPNEAILASAPRILNEPVRWRFSAFIATVIPTRSLSVRELSSGVSRMTPVPASAARRMSSADGSAGRWIEAGSASKRHHRVHLHLRAARQGRHADGDPCGRA